MRFRSFGAPLAHRDAPTYKHRLSCDKTCILAAEETDGAGYIIRRPHPPHRDRGDEAACKLGVRRIVAPECGRSNGTRRDAIHRNAVAGEFKRPGARHRLQCALCRAIECAGRLAERDTARVHYDATPPALAYCGDERLGGDKRRARVQMHEPVEVVYLHFVERRW